MELEELKEKKWTRFQNILLNVSGRKRKIKQSKKFEMPQTCLGFFFTRVAKQICIIPWGKQPSWKKLNNSWTFSATDDWRNQQPIHCKVPQEARVREVNEPTFSHHPSGCFYERKINYLWQIHRRLDTLPFLPGSLWTKTFFQCCYISHGPVWSASFAAILVKPRERCGTQKKCLDPRSERDSTPKKFSGMHFPKLNIVHPSKKQKSKKWQAVFLHAQ